MKQMSILYMLFILQIICIFQIRSTGIFHGYIHSLFHCYIHSSDTHIDSTNCWRINQAGV